MKRLWGLMAVLGTCFIPSLAHANEARGLSSSFLERAIRLQGIAPGHMGEFCGHWMSLQPPWRDAQTGVVLARTLGQMGPMPLETLRACRAQVLSRCVGSACHQAAYGEIVTAALSYPQAIEDAPSALQWMRDFLVSPDISAFRPLWPELMALWLAYSEEIAARLPRPNLDPLIQMLEQVDELELAPQVSAGERVELRALYEHLARMDPLGFVIQAVDPQYPRRPPTGSPARTLQLQVAAEVLHARQHLPLSLRALFEQDFSANDEDPRWARTFPPETLAGLLGEPAAQEVLIALSAMRFQATTACVHESIRGDAN